MKDHFKRGKYLYIPLEIVVREHDGKVTLAHEAAAAGWTVVIGTKLHLYAVRDQLPQGVFIIKSATPREHGQIKALKMAGHSICSLDEEGVVTFREFLGNNVRFCDENVVEIDRVFFWGNEQQKAFNDVFPSFSDKGVVSGSPRLEFWRDYAADSYKDRVDELRKQYGQYVLLPSSFGIANNALGGDMGVLLTRNHSQNISKELSDFLTGQGEQNLIAFKEYLAFLPEIVTHFPDTNFIIRPHPSESHKPWQDLASKFQNVHLVYEGSVTPWILAAAAVFHFKSTVSLESHVMGRKALTYVPPMPAYMARFELKLPMILSEVTTTREAFLECLADVLGGQEKKASGEIEGLAKDWISVDPKQSSAKRIMGEMEKIAPEATRFPEKFEKPLKKVVREAIESVFYRLNDIPAVHVRLPRRVRNRMDGITYGARKESGLDLAHTQNILDTISAKSGDTDAKIQAKALTENIFVIRKEA